MSYIKINNDYLRTPEYIIFNKATKSTVYFFILSSVIRESEDIKNYIQGANYIFNEYYIKGNLVGRYSLEKIAEYLGFKSHGYISKMLTELEQDGFIKKIKRQVSVGEISYYQVGVWTGAHGEESYEEILWFDTIFSGYAEVAKQKRNEHRDTKFHTMIEMVENLKVENYKGPFNRV